MIYVGSLDSYLYALTTAGTLKWRYQTSGGIYSSPAQAPDGSIYVGSDDNYLHAIARDDGSRLWRYHTASYDVYSSPAIGADGTIYVGSENSLLYALTAAGELIWSYDTGGAIISSPAIDSAGNIYFGSIDHYLYSLSPQGDLNWRYATDGDIYSSPAIASNGSIYFGSGDDKFYALRSAASGLQADSPWPKFRYNALNQGSSHNLRPSAEAGAEDQVLEGNTFTFNGTATDPDGTIAAFAWSQVQGISVSIADANSANASFIAPGVEAATELLFQLQVTDSSGGTGTDTVTITVLDNPDNQPPTVDAGDNQSQFEGTEVSLNGSASDEDGSIVAYSWRQLEGPEVTIIDSSSALASFTAPAVDTDTNLSFQLLVTDDDSASAADVVSITVLPNEVPIVDAGINQSLSTGVIASLRGSASDNDGTIISYLWSETSTSITSSGGVDINRADTATANFSVPDNLSTGTILTFELTATDYLGASSSDSTTVTIATEGSLRWRYQADNAIYSSPAIDTDGTVYVGSDDNYLYAIAPPSGGSESGELLWRYKTGDQIRSSPAVGSDGTVYVGSLDNYLYAIAPPNDDSQSGMLRWSYQTQTVYGIYSDPAIGSDGKIYVSDRNNYLYAVAPPSGGSQSGVLQWRYDQAGDHTISSPTIGNDGTVYAGSTPTGSPYYDLLAIAPPSDSGQYGVRQWSYPTGEDVSSAPAIGTDGIVYVGSDDDYLYAIAAPSDGSQDGVLQWHYQTGGDIDSSPAIGADGTIYVGSGDKYLYAIAPPSDNSQSGVLLWRYQTGGPISSSPAIGADGTVYVSSRDHYLYAIAPPNDGGQSGTLQWRYQTGDEIHSSPAIDSDGTVYVGSDDGYLYAITSSSPDLADSAWPKFGYDNQGVGRANVAPTAEAGGSDQDIAAGATVNLDGSSSIDPDGAIIDYYWQETSGFDISILNNNSAQASFTAPDDLSSDAILTIQLTVTDNSGATATDTLEVSVSANP